MDQELATINRVEYDDAADVFWRLTVFDAVHDGWWFACIGGRTVLDFVGERGQLTGRSHALELCSGIGDTCRYLATTYGCAVRGIDVNDLQVERARNRVAAFDIESRVRFVHADVLNWTPSQAYDVVYAVDALMLLEARDRALRTAHAALRGTGLLIFADVLAGPHMTRSVQAFVRAEDGITALPTPQAQVATLSTIGFTCVEVRDLTELAVDCFARIAAASVAYERVLVRAKGRDRYRRWLRNARLYRRWFANRTLVYTLIAAVPEW